MKGHRGFTGMQGPPGPSVSHSKWSQMHSQTIAFSVFLSRQTLCSFQILRVQLESKDPLVLLDPLDPE